MPRPACWGLEGRAGTATLPAEVPEREFFIDDLLVRKMIWWTGLAPWEFEFPFLGSLISTFLAQGVGAVRKAERVPRPSLSRCQSRRSGISTAQP